MVRAIGNWGYNTLKYYRSYDAGYSSSIGSGRYHDPAGKFFEILKGRTPVMSSDLLRQINDSIFEKRITQSIAKNLWDSLKDQNNELFVKTLEFIGDKDITDNSHKRIKTVLELSAFCENRRESLSVLKNPDKSSRKARTYFVEALLANFPYADNTQDFALMNVKKEIADEERAARSQTHTEPFENIYRSKEFWISGSGNQLVHLYNPPTFGNLLGIHVAALNNNYNNLPQMLREPHKLIKEIAIRISINKIENGSVFYNSIEYQHRVISELLLYYEQWLNFFRQQEDI